MFIPARLQHGNVCVVLKDNYNDFIDVLHSIKMSQYVNIKP